MQIEVVRTSMASPWVTVLSDALKSHTWMGYGLGAIFGLHRLLNMIMRWQLSRQVLKERETLRELLARHLAEIGAVEGRVAQGPNRGDPPMIPGAVHAGVLGDA